jgi:ribosomal protein S24E
MDSINPISGIASSSLLGSSIPLSPQGKAPQNPRDAFTRSAPPPREGLLKNLEALELTREKARGDLELIEKTMKSGESFDDAAQAFLKLLGAQGRYASDQVGRHYVIIGDSLRSREARSMAADEFLRLYKAEEKASDAEGGFQVIRSQQGQKESLKEATDAYMKLLATEGKYATEGVMRHYVTIGNSLQQGETRDAATGEFLRLYGSEEKAEDAETDFKAIRKNQKQQESLKEATDAFMKLLSAEGKYATTNIQRHHTMIGDSLQPGETRDAVTGEFLRLYGSEEKSEDAETDFITIRKNQKQGESLKEATDAFMKLLSAEGKYATPNIQRHHTMIGDSLRPGETRDAVTGEFLRLYGSEEKAEDAETDFITIRKNQKQGESLKEATDAFLKLLSFEGKYATPIIQKHHAMIGDSLRAGETRSSAGEQFLRLCRAEEKTEDAEGNYRLIDGFVSQRALDIKNPAHSLFAGKSDRESLTTLFLNCLNEAGGKYATVKARQLFETKARVLKAADEFVDTAMPGEKKDDQPVETIDEWVVIGGIKIPVKDAGAPK